MTRQILKSLPDNSAQALTEIVPKYQTSTDIKSVCCSSTEGLLSQLVWLPEDLNVQADTAVIVAPERHDGTQVNKQDSISPKYLKCKDIFCFVLSRHQT